MIKSLLLISILFISTLSKAQNLIAIQHNGFSFFVSNLDSAITHAQNGDTIYIPGGNYTMYKPINKSLHLVGTGYFADSNAATSISLINSVILTKGSDGGSIEGLYINGTLQFGDNTDTSKADVDRFTIKRCYLNGDILFSFYYGGNLSRTNRSTNISILESIFGSISGQQIGILYVSNCLVRGTVFTVSNSLFQNNIFLYSCNFCSTLAVTGNSNVIKNNIFYKDFIMCGVNNQYYNNIGVQMNGVYTGTYATNAFGSGNFTAPWDSLFINSSFNLPFDYPNINYHLRANSSAINAGTNGTDIGIYGGPFPWKDGGIPFNPHIQIKTIAPKTNSSGTLPVNIKVKSQDN